MFQPWDWRDCRLEPAKGAERPMTATATHAAAATDFMMILLLTIATSPRDLAGTNIVRPLAALSCASGLDPAFRASPRQNGKTLPFECKIERRDARGRNFIVTAATGMMVRHALSWLDGTWSWSPSK